MTLEEARCIALQELKRNYRDHDKLAIVDEDTMERPYGWIFFYEAKSFLETRNPLWALLGNAPIVVEKSTGRVSRLGTARNLEVEIAEFEARLYPR